MAKTKISEFSANPANNTDIDSINIAEGCAPSGINDAIRELMAQLKDFQAGTAGDSFNGPVGTTTAAAGAFTTLSASGAVTLSGGTANGVAYLNGSKVLTTGSALWFDGTNFGVGTGGNALNHQSVIYKGGANAVYQQVANGSTGLASTNGVRLGVSAAGLGELYSPTALISYISNSEAMRLTSTGLGIGTSSPGTKLDVRGTIQSVASGAGLSAISSSTFYYMNVSSTGLDTYTDANASAPMLFKTGGTERMRLDSSGNLLVGTTVQPTGVTGGAGFIRLGSARSTLYTASTTTSSAGLVVFLNPNGEVGSISTSGTATTYATSSDYRLKNITGPITTSGAYIDSLNPVEGTWKADGSTFVGLIAHEVQEASRTNVATGVKDGEEMQGMDYSSAEIIANLIAEVKSLRQRLAAAGI